MGSSPDTLAVCGDPVVGGALVVLLRGSGYPARFLPVSSLSEPGSLEGVRLLLLAPTPELSVEHREDLLAALKETLKIPILVLTTPSEEARVRKCRGVLMVPWPCRRVDLERWIEDAMLPSLL